MDWRGLYMQQASGKTFCGLPRSALKIVSRGYSFLHGERAVDSFFSLRCCWELNNRYVPCEYLIWAVRIKVLWFWFYCFCCVRLKKSVFCLQQWWWKFFNLFVWYRKTILFFSSTSTLLNRSNWPEWNEFKNLKKRIFQKFFF